MPNDNKPRKGGHAQEVCPEQEAGSGPEQEVGSGPEQEAGSGPEQEAGSCREPGNNASSDTNGGRQPASMKARAVTGAVWLFMERGGVGVIEFIFAWVLARYFLMPEDYALVGICALFIAFAGLFTQGSINYSLIQKKDISEGHKSAVFWVAAASALILYAVMFFAAPWIAGLYEKTVLVWLLRIQGLTLLFDSFCVVQAALLTREMRFKVLFAKTAMTVTLAGVTGIVSAALGLGVWALVLSTCVASFTGCIFLWIACRWRPGVRFRLKALSEMLGFGSAMLASNIINNVYASALPLLMEKLYPADTLGYYNKSKTIPGKVSETINTTVANVAFPSLSAFQEDPGRVRDMMRRFIKVSSFATFAVMAGLFAVAKPMILFIYSDKWANSVVFMQFICVMSIFLPMDSANLQAIKAFGRGGAYLLLEVIKNVLGFGALIAALLLTGGMGITGLYIVMAVQTAVSFICTGINASFGKKLMNYSVFQQLRDVLPSLLLAAVMGAAVYSVTFLRIPYIVMLLIQVPLGVAIYFAGAKLFKMDSLEYILDILKDKLRKKNNKGSAG
ncbi:MAG: lipopolysaccharide biosynthesis protein [Clostridia bacterium]|nr:lipopolysaccharide biosynthesis protein [Clostridia bacterium]